MNLVFEIDTSALKAQVAEIRERLGSASSTAVNISPEKAERIADVLRRSIKEQFAAGGPGWKPLAESTVRQKERQGYPRLTRSGRMSSRSVLLQRGALSPRSILIRTGALVSSLTNPSDPDHVVIISENEVAVSSSLPYFAYHQQGRGVPQRPLFVRPQDLDEIARILEEA